MSPVIFEILLALKECPLDADAIGRCFQDHGSSAPPIASFYRSLKRASEEGLLTVIDSGTDGALGRPRQHYALTRSGQRALRAEASRLRRLADLALSPKGSESRS